jgi:hypothetical protein
MEEFEYKVYTEEETRIYNAAIPKILQGIKDGLPFCDACNLVQIDDKTLKQFVEDDALKIVLAELHYSQKLSLEEISAMLSVSLDVITQANDEMLEDIGITASEVFRKQDTDGPYGNA